ncbi:MAG TPA: hypothetical protein VEL07_09860 [Planctomycetota bacterium]|nr:hypothetical protein [Planctomycetota bacterium]
MARPLIVLLLALSVPAAIAAEDGAAPPTAVVAAIDPTASEAELAANAVRGVVAITRRLAADGIAAYAFDAAQRAAFFRGMPPRIRNHFSAADEHGAPVDLVGIDLQREDDGGYRFNLRFRDDWIAKGQDPTRRLGSTSMKGHDATIYLSRRALVTARVECDAIVDARAAADADRPYKVIQHNRKILSEDIQVKELEQHPWRDRAPIGLCDMQGLSLQISIAGWWKNATDIQPCTHLVIHPDEEPAHIWLAYKEMAEQVDRKRGFMQIGNDEFARGMTAEQAFPTYLDLPMHKDDHFSVIDLTVECAAVEP